MYPRLNEFDSFTSKLKERLIGKKINHLRLSSNGTFSYSLNNKNRLVISLDKQNPCIYIGNSALPYLESTSSLFFYMRKNISEGIIKNINRINDDRILEIEIENLNAIYQKITFFLVLELLPNKGNLIILDSNKKIIMALNPSTLDSSRILTHGATYCPPLLNIQLNETNDFDIDSFFSFCLEEEEKEEEKLLLKQYAPKIKELKNKKRGLERKINAIEIDIAKAKEHINDGEIGNYIFVNLDNIHLEEGFFSYYGKKIELDKKKSLTKNAQKFFLQQKKAKSTIENGKENLDKAIKELNELDALLSFLSSLNAERLSLFFKEEKKEGSKEEKIVSFSIYPYLVKEGNTKFAFGHSDKSNDFLTFIYCNNKEYTWMHVKNNHGAHLLIEKANPSKEELQLGCELTLLASKLDFGEVIVCKRKEIKKGNKIGEVKLGHYESFYIRRISKKGKELFLSKKKGL
ncbi:MAG TPA: hypothetical protein DCR94_01935 [Firmicutes bacterium]|nr:hypothetical protein [Bacillota bacterium]